MERFFLILGAVILSAIPIQAAPQDPAAGLEFFEKKIRPMLSGHCYACHSAETKPAGGLRVDDRNGLLIGGNTGPALVPGDPEKSSLIRRVTQKEEKRRMPLEGDHLTPQEVADLTKWIKEGAPWPAVKVPASLGKLAPEYQKLKQTHWAWQPIQDAKVPEVKDAAWPKGDIDRFILAELEKKELKPVGDADRVALIRRVTFDLTGLPPSPEQIEHFVKDQSPQAFEKLVDQLLASPAFGERWGRHWLDVARYGESTGPSRNIPYTHAWKYRDYVIAAINSDVPFDRFIREQIAGDHLAEKVKEAGEHDRLLTATGFLALGVKDVNQRFKVRFIMDNVDEQIDAVSRSFLGLTVSCARCHDHKFDPIPTTDYYSLAGIFTSTDNAAGVRNKMGGGGLDYYDPAMLLTLRSNLPPVDPAKLEKLKAEVADAKKAWDGIRGTPEGLKPAANGQPTQRPFRLKYERLQAELLGMSDPASQGHAVHGVRDAKAIADTEVRIRGEAEKLGPVVPRGFLTTFEVAGAPKVNPKESGRAELAEWLTSTNNPLTTRVYVNRIWQHLFGQGIVTTVDNFGVNGDVPTHPELLDYLAKRFVREGWSTKKLVKAIVLTRVYGLSAEKIEANQKVDPANRLVWRHSSRRLDAEELRDSILAAAGSLQPVRPAGSPAKELKMIEMRDNGPEAKTIHDSSDKSHARSVYLPLLRGVTPKALEPFDPVEQTLVTGKREVTTVPAQALFLLNSSFVRKESLTLAERLLKNNDETDADRIKKAYQLLVGRTPSETEVGRVQTFLAEYESAERETAPIVEPEKPKETVVKPKGDTPPPFDPDQVDQTGEETVQEVIKPRDRRTSAWMMRFDSSVNRRSSFPRKTCTKKSIVLLAPSMIR
jgi:mono/diheme cytochrome c family protein